jgi:hypothetical protein
MTDHDDLTRPRRYERLEVAELLNIKDTWLKVWGTADLVPHQRSGKPGPRQRGVWFTYDDVMEIGRRLPTLMSPRQANHRAEAPPESTPAESVEVATEPDEDFLDQFAGLRSLRTHGA